MTAPEDIDSELQELEQQLGTRLSAKLRAAPVGIPAEADRAARAVIRSRAAEIRRDAARAHRRLWPVFSAATAAALLLAAGTWWTLSSLRTPLRGDVDRSGRVDIVDAYLLARRIEEGDRTESDWDLTGDGQVNAADVTAVARRSVSLSGGNR